MVLPLRTVSGMRPTGPLHLGHYFGALKKAPLLIFLFQIQSIQLIILDNQITINTGIFLFKIVNKPQQM